MSVFEDHELDYKKLILSNKLKADELVTISIALQFSVQRWNIWLYQKPRKKFVSSHVGKLNQSNNKKTQLCFYFSS